MKYRSMTLKGCTIPNFKLNGMILHVVASYKYLGHYITDDLSDDDINRQRRTLFVQGNIILKFYMYSMGVKLTLFHTYCSPRSMYTAQLWWNYKNLPLLNYKLLISCNIFLMFLGMSKYMKAPATYAQCKYMMSPCICIRPYVVYLFKQIQIVSGLLWKRTVLGPRSYI